MNFDFIDPQLKLCIIFSIIKMMNFRKLFSNLFFVNFIREYNTKNVKKMKHSICQFFTFHIPYKESNGMDQNFTYQFFNISRRIWVSGLRRRIFLPLFCLSVRKFLLTGYVKNRLQIRYGGHKTSGTVPLYVNPIISSFPQNNSWLKRYFLNDIT